jgi:hypothetical protein
MTSKYIKCDEPGCEAVVDRTTPEHPLGGHHGTFDAIGGGAVARAYARSLGWTIVDGRDLCPTHSAKASTTAPICWFHKMPMFQAPTGQWVCFICMCPATDTNPKPVVSGYKITINGKMT